MKLETLALEVDDRGVASLELALPDKRNALSAGMIAELTDVTNALGKDDTVRAVVLRARGTVFCAGGDLAWMQAQMAADRETRVREARKLAMMLQALNTMPKPLIGRVHGDAFGGGVGMICVCDVVVAAREAKFALTETRLGLIPATIGPYVIARLGEGVARRVFMSGRVFDATEARNLGLVAEVVDAANLDEAVERHVRPYLSTAPGAVGAAKALARFLGPRIDDAVIEETIRRLADVWETAEASEGITAFFEKRPAPWAAKK
jgi:methylglutaconyl-CoA hydratase